MSQEGQKAKRSKTSRTSNPSPDHAATRLVIKPLSEDDWCTFSRHALVTHLTTYTQHENREAKEKRQDRRILQSRTYAWEQILALRSKGCALGQKGAFYGTLDAICGKNVPKLIFSPKSSSVAVKWLHRRTPYLWGTLMIPVKTS